MTREKLIKELEKKLKFSKKDVLTETVCMPEWPMFSKKATKKNGK